MDSHLGNLSLELVIFIFSLYTLLTLQILLLQESLLEPHPEVFREVYCSGSCGAHLYTTALYTRTRALSMLFCNSLMNCQFH